MNALSKGHRRGIARVLALAACLCAMLAAGMLAGCSSPAQGESEGQPEPAAEKALEGKTLDIYCGAGMTDPFQEIADAFQAETGDVYKRQAWAMASNLSSGIVDVTGIVSGLFIIALAVCTWQVRGQTGYFDEHP